MSSLVSIVHSVYSGSIYSSDIIASRKTLERSKTLRDLLPPPDRKYVTTHDVHRAFKAIACNRKSGHARVSMIWGLASRRAADLTDDGIRAFCEQVRIEALDQPGRPPNWPFPTWGGAAA